MTVAVICNTPNAMRAHVDELYGEACARGTTYEKVVHTLFCKSVQATYGDDEDATDVVAAFTHARDVYGYQNAVELAASQAADKDKGVCSHGLDSMTCPAGCFED